MNDNARRLIVAGIVLAFLAVLLGAFGAHALKSQLAPDMLAVYQTGAQYHLPQALGIVLIGVLIRLQPDSKWLLRAGWMMVLGVVLFSGSLYALSISGVRALGLVTPVGGLALLGAWAMVAFAMATNQS